MDKKTDNTISKYTTVLSNMFNYALKNSVIKFKPEFLIFSMGFDANIADPLAQFELKSEDFYED